MDVRQAGKKKKKKKLPMHLMGLSGSASGKESTGQCRRPWRCRFYPKVGKDQMQQEMATHPNTPAWEIP